MNTIKDIIKNNITQMALVENLSLQYIFLVFGIAFVCGLIIYFVYKYFYRGAVYSENFGLLIIMSVMTVAFIIMTISSNIVLSLGMVGALSIVRFRTAVKDPLDVGFLFLAIGAGLTAGAGLLLIAVIGTVVICMVYIAMFCFDRRSMMYLLVVRCENGVESSIEDRLKHVKYKLRSQVSDGSVTEVIYTVNVKNKDILGTIIALDGVSNASLVAYTGDGQY